MERSLWDCRPLGLALLVAGLLVLSGARLRADDSKPVREEENPALKAASALYADIRTEVLPNGLHVYLKPIKDSPVVTTMVAYKVGSGDEELEHTGLSHYLEHLMFKGTEKLKPGDIDRLTQRNGGMNNAYTSEDYTIFYFDFAADRWETALDIEADRMRNLRIDPEHEFEQEKGAVIAELERDEDEPWNLEEKGIVPLLFGSGPYGHPVIGERQHVRAATAQIIKSHYDRWYYPNNASLVVCGGFDPDQAMSRIRKLFGPLPEGKLPERRKIRQEPLKRPDKLVVDSKFEVPRLLIGYNAVSTSDPDSVVLDVLQSILTGGKTGRLYRKLVEDEEVASAVGASNNAGRYPGWFSIQVELLKGKDLGQVEKLVLEEVQRLRDEPVTAAELKRVKESVLSGAVFSRESVHDLADSIARGVTTNDLDYLKNLLPRIMAVTPEDIQRVARKYLDPEKRVVVWSVPRQKGKVEERDKERQSSSSPHSSLLTPHSLVLARRDAKDETTGGGENLSLKDAHRVELPNGMVLLLFENHRLPILVAKALARHVHLHEPEDKAGLADLVGNLLDEGTSRHSGQEIAEKIEDVGGALALDSSGGSVQVLSNHRSLGLGLLLECLSDSNFPEQAFKRERERQLSEIDEAMEQPETRALLAYREMVYGKHHPSGRPSMGVRATVEKLTREDCVAFHRKVFVPNNMILAIVGDFDSQEVTEEVKKLTADWKKEPLAKPEVPKAATIAQFSEKIISMPDAAQLHFFMGHLGIRRNNPDYYKLLVMDYVLGTGTGFTDRLSARLRDREGLGYTVTASITGTAGEEPGTFTCYIGTAPKHFARVKELFLEELNRIRDEKPTQREVEDAKLYLLGSLPFQLTTSDRIADRLLYAERYGLGFDYLDEYRRAVAAVTADDVQAVARKYLDPKHMVLVAAGAVDKQGKPLP